LLRIGRHDRDRILSVEWFDLVLKISALIGGILAIVTYRRTAKVRRAEWLSNLHAKFFEADGYKEIRRILDSDGQDPQFIELRNAELEALLKESVERRKW
jgi:hypothetical protein